MKRFLVIGLAALLCASCVTKQLWEATDYRERIFIPENQITRAELDRRGVEYEYVPADSQTDAEAGNTQLRVGGFLVPKDTAQKFRDHAYRALATPITLTIDTAYAAGYAVSIVGVYWIGNDPGSFSQFVQSLNH